jgi:hypothetical protein
VDAGRGIENQDWLPAVLALWKARQEMLDALNLRLQLAIDPGADDT